MKSVRLHGTGDLRIHEEPAYIAGIGEALVQGMAMGICGSDLQWFSRSEIGDAQADRPLTLGHELSRETDDGRRVAVHPAILVDCLCL